MLVKVKKGDQTLQFNSQNEDIAILLTPKDKQAIQEMPREDLLIVSAPFSSMKTQSNVAEVWQWARQDWKGATLVDLDNLRTKF